MKKIYFKNLKEYLGKEICIEGFVDNIRNLQYVQFLVLRDSTGKLQITIEKNEDNSKLNEIVNELTCESTLKVKGVLVKNEKVKRYPDDEDLLEDVIIENKQAMEMANIYNGILSGMVDTFASVISNNLNIVMKFLATVTIVMSIPTMIASFYGMNVPLPGQDNPYGFYIVLGFALFLAGIVAFIFHKKDLF